MLRASQDCPAAHHPCAARRSSTPTVLRHSAQRLRVRELPWVTAAENLSTLKGLQTVVGTTVTFNFCHNPLRVERILTNYPQGSSVLAASLPTAASVSALPVG